MVLTGDLNCAHKEIDIHNPKGNLRSAGFTIVRGTGAYGRIAGRGGDKGQGACALPMQDKGDSSPRCGCKGCGQ